MKTKWSLLLAFILFFISGLRSQNKSFTKIACIGNSITYGAYIQNRIRDSYPAQLSQMLGEEYIVRNYGNSGRTMLMKGDLPYMNEEQFFDAIAWNPDIVIIKLGSNDAKAKNWKYASEFESDYQKMINAFDTLSSHPKIYLATTVPVFKEGIGIDAKVVREEIIPLIKKIAQRNHLELIDLYTPFIDKAKLFPDNVHPNAEGAGEMAKVVYQHITGKPGGVATVIPCTKGKQDLRGHHFVIESPRVGADFIEYHSQTPPPLNSSAYHQLRKGLTNSLKKFEEKKTARVAFVGGSITYNPGWRDSVSQYIEKRFPETDFEFIAAGIPSMGSTCDAFRLERDIFMTGKVDLVFVEAAVNDHFKGRPQKEIQRSMEGIIRQIHSNNPSADVIFMYFVDPEMIKDYNRKTVPEVIQFHDKVAAYYQIPAINLAREVTERIAAGEFSWDKDFKNLHPSPFGQGIYAHSIIAFLDQAWNEKNQKPSTEVFPEKLDKACYDMGKLIPASEIPLQKGWKYVQDWQPAIKANTRSNYVNVPMLIGDQTSKPLKISFKGNAVGLAVAAGPDAGIIEYSIDGGAWQKQDLFTKHSTAYHLPWYFMLADGLRNGKHILKIKLSTEKNEKSIGHRCVLRYVFVNTDK